MKTVILTVIAIVVLAGGALAYVDVAIQLEDATKKVETAENELESTERVARFGFDCLARAEGLMYDSMDLVADLYEYGDDSTFWGDVRFLLNGVEKYETDCQPERNDS